MAADGAYWAATEDCIVCQRDDYATGEFGPRTLVTCDCCLDKGVHVECWHKHSGELLSSESLASPAFQWFCSEVRAGRGDGGAAAAAAEACARMQETRAASSRL